MQSPAGTRFIALDHIRASAALLVFSWHFLHWSSGYPVPFATAPVIFPLALMDEGHVGVALFMTLSGYLFAKLLSGANFSFAGFFWNRALRLLPLLALVIVICGTIAVVNGRSATAYIASIAKGLLYPTLPNGGWSITVEFHFYLLLPGLLWLLRKSTLLPLLVVALAIVGRAVLHHMTGEVQTLAFWTIVGRIDQFVLGMLCFQWRYWVAHRHLPVAFLLVVFAAFYWYFDYLGGFYRYPYYPSPSALWIYLPTLEGAVFAIAIAWYDNSFTMPTTGVSGFIGRIGEYSYSIYLLHIFFVAAWARWVHENLVDLSNFYMCVLWSLAGFLLMVPIGYLSFRFVEKPFLKLRKPYVIGLDRKP
jgi:peptidoglycan/LPS O-acetylase OafA/YrhL